MLAGGRREVQEDIEGGARGAENLRKQAPNTMMMWGGGGIAPPAPKSFAVGTDGRLTNGFAAILA